MSCTEPDFRGIVVYGFPEPVRTRKTSARACTCAELKRRTHWDCYGTERDDQGVRNCQESVRIHDIAYRVVYSCRVSCIFCSASPAAQHSEKDSHETYIFSFGNHSARSYLGVGENRMFPPKN